MGDFITMQGRKFMNQPYKFIEKSNKFMNQPETRQLFI